MEYPWNFSAYFWKSPWNPIETSNAKIQQPSNRRPPEDPIEGYQAEGLLRLLAEDGDNSMVPEYESLHVPNKITQSCR